MRGIRVTLLVLTLVLLSWTASAQAVSINFVGSEQVVYDYGTMACFQYDQPDIPVRAFRDYLGRVQMILPGANTRMIGPDLDNLTHDCTVVVPQLRRAAPSDFADVDWVSAIFTTDGQEVFTLLHDEYHGYEHAGYCGEPFIKCRTNAVTLARSTNGGDLYVRPTPPTHMIAAMPYRYVPGDGRYGFFTPSNIVQKDGWYYSMVLSSSTYRAQRAGVCLMRTQNIADPKSWRAWDGTGFNVRFIDPYRESGDPLAAHVCEPVAPDEIGELNRSITYNTAINKYIVSGTSTKWEPALGRTVTGFYYSLSDDLIHWTESQLLLETPRPWMCGDPEAISYPSFLDPDSSDRNFGTSNQRLYLYYTASRHQNCISTQTLDLKRREIEVLP
jgi:hypothetical protein